MFFADLHIHSKFSRATGKDADLEHMALWGRKKGVTVIGTGDFTHPQWMKELREKLVPAEPGLFRLRDDLERDVQRQLNESGFGDSAAATSTQADSAVIAQQAARPELLQGVTRFLLEVEISTIYKKGDFTRKVHHCIYAPDFDAADKLIARLSRIGNLASDGRPILGLDSRHLLEIVLESSPQSYLIPAHIWTPWFAVLGSKSGFDRVEDCYGDLTKHIFALETGLSSDPPMNWRLSQLDRFTLVSNSDAHSPPKIGREACAFACDLSYFAMKQALETRNGYAGTVEFFPEEGKYHLDGHRTCGVRLTPPETKELDRLCPTCGKELTIGVMHRIDELADRPEEFMPAELQPSARNLIPLPEVIGEIKGMGESSKAVQAAYDQALAKVGSELFILDQAPPEELRRLGSPVLADAIERMRAGKVIRDAGYDGEYGVIRVFQPGELANRGMKSLLFEEVERPESRDESSVEKAEGKRQKAVEKTAAAKSRPITDASVDVLSSSLDSRPSTLDSLDTDQRAAAEHARGPLLIIAGPGTGKTRTLTQRVAHLVLDKNVPPEQCLTITFSHRAASELEERLTALLPKSRGQVPVLTFHALGLLILQEHAERCGLPASFGIATEQERIEALRAAGNLSERHATRLLEAVSRHKRQVEADSLENFALYQQVLRDRGWVDFDDLILLPTRMLADNPAVAAAYRARWPFVSVDEFQDIDAGQYELLRRITSSDGNVCVIGDPDQAIYGFRGADPKIFDRFAADFPTAERVLLRKNYRSTSTIVSAALQAIRPTSLVADRELEAVLEETDFIDIQTCPTDKAEAEFVVHSIERLIGGSTMFSLDSGRVARGEGESWSFRDFAVLYRTDSQANALVEAFERSGMPYQRNSHKPLAEHPAIQAMCEWLQRAEITRSVSEGRTDHNSNTPSLTLRVTSETSVVEQLKQAADAVWSAHPEVATLLPQLHPLAERCGNELPKFLHELSLATEVDLRDPRADRVALLTLHAAKGLEFGVVFLVGCEDGLLPLRFGGQPLTDSEEAEERRLFFVGLTRARRRLILSHAERRLWRGQSQALERSPFLTAIESELLRRTGHSGPRRKQKAQVQRLLFE